MKVEMTLRGTENLPSIPEVLRSFIGHRIDVNMPSVRVERDGPINASAIYQRVTSAGYAIQDSKITV